MSIPIKANKSQPQLNFSDSDDAQDLEANLTTVQENTSQSQTRNLNKQCSQKSSISTQKKKIILPKFQTKEARKMTITDLLDIYLSLQKRRETRHKDEAEKYMNHIAYRIKSLETDFEDQQERARKLQEERDMLKEAIKKKEKSKNEEIKSTNEEKLKELKNIIEKLTKELQEKENKIKQQEENTEKLKSNINNESSTTMQEEIEKLLKIVSEKDEQILNYEKERMQNNKEKEMDLQLKSKEEITSQYQLLKSSYDHLHNDILEKMKHIEVKTTEIHEILHLQDKSHIINVNEDETQGSWPQLPSGNSSAQYSEKFKMMKPGPPFPIFSKQAILLTRKPTSRMSMFDIRDTLNRKLQNTLNIPRIHCTLSRNKRTLIIQTAKDEEIKILSDTIQENKEIMDIINLTLTTEKRKKIIILGIPKYITSDEIITKIKRENDQISEITLHKVISRENAKTHQLVLELEAHNADRLLKQGKLLLGFVVCKLAIYAPIIRCNNCQRYGHTGETCIRQKACAYCTKIHDTHQCPEKNKPDKHKCINCMRSKDDTGEHLDHCHSANSTDCYIYQDRIHFRNREINNTVLGSRI